MYDFSGIYEWIVSDILLFGTGIVLFLYSSKFWEKDSFDNNKNDIAKVRERKRYVFIAVAFCICLIVMSSDNLIAVKNPDIEVYEGDFVKRYHERYTFGYRYVFSDTYEDSLTFILDKQTEGNLIPGGFVKGEKYRIYYEDRTNVIIRVETID